MIMRAKGGATAISRAQMEASIDREDELLLRNRRLEREAIARGQSELSSSSITTRCATCGQWPRFDVRGGQRVCVGDGGFGHPFVATPLIGSPGVTDGAW